jgi:hypothetical protein
MKFGITKYELFALTSHLVGKPCPNPEYGRKRLRTWDELGVSDLADSLATGAAMGGEIPLAEWRDKKTPHLVDINADILDHLIAGLGQEMAGVWADTLTRLRGRLEALRDKKYELPQELRTESIKAVG